ncbi:MAG: GDSL-type esterase/lipase family protein [Cyclobacteriaceae bacterium]
MRKIALLSLFIGLVHVVCAQDPERFKDQVQEIRATYPPNDYQDVVLFTGSSTIRMWKCLQEDFPQHKIVNAGFGGSQASDLLHYTDELILDYSPTKVFIYEGDNDLSAGKSIQKIIETLKLIVTQIHLEHPNTEIILISAKPSVARWELADKYRALNQEMKSYSLLTEKVRYANLWTVMLDDNRAPMKDIFLEDNLHMNQKGYTIWAKAIGPFLK